MADWHLEKSFTVGNIVTTLALFSSAALYLASIEGEIDHVKLEQAHIKSNIIRIESQQHKSNDQIKIQIERMASEQKQDNLRIESKIDKLIDRELNGH